MGRQESKLVKFIRTILVLQFVEENLLDNVDFFFTGSVPSDLSPFCSRERIIF